MKVATWAIARVASREISNHPIRSCLVITSIAIPICAVVTGYILFTSAIPTRSQELTSWFSAADLRVIERTTDSPLDMAHLLPPGTEVMELQSRSVTVELPGDRAQFMISNLELESPLAEGRLVLMAGQPPDRPSEIALSKSLLDKLRLKIGDTVHLTEPDQQFTVSGRVANPMAVSRDEAITVGAAIPPSQTRTWLIDSGGLDPQLIKGHLQTAVGPHRLDIVLRSEMLRTLKKDQRPSLTALIGGAFLIVTSLVTSSALAISANRNVRSFALLAANGAEPQRLRQVVFFESALLGVLGSFGGAAIGVVVALATMPSLAGLANRVHVDLVLPIVPIVLTTLSGLIAVMIAGMVPAVAAGRTQVRTALDMRTPKRQGRSTTVAPAILLITGLGWTWLGASISDSPYQPLLAAGAVATLAGAVFATKPLVRLLGRLAARLPALPRVAARDLGRSPGRVVPTMGATIAIWALAVGLLSVTASREQSEKDEYIPTLRDDQLQVVSSGPPVETTAFASAALAASQAIPGAVSAPVRVAAASAVDRSSWVQAIGGPPLEAVRNRGLVAEASEDLLTVLAVPEEAVQLLADGMIVGIGRDTVADRTVDLQVPRPTPIANPRQSPDAGLSEQEDSPSLPPMRYETQVIQAKARAIDTESYGALPLYLASPATLQSFGLDTAVESWVIRSPRPLTKGEIRSARLRVEPGRNIYITVEERPTTNDAFRYGLALFAVGISIAISSLATVLAINENGHEIALMFVVGAAPRFLRVYAGSQAFLMAGIAAMIAVPIGLASALSGLTSYSDYPIVIPWPTVILGTMAIAIVPTVAALVWQPSSRESMQVGDIR